MLILGRFLILETQIMRTIFITGRSTGLGNAAVRLFAANGWKVIATIRNLDNGTELTALENDSYAT